jgi:hypothetical protein
MPTGDVSATNDTTTGLWDVVTDPSDSFGDIDIIDRADGTSGGMGTDPAWGEEGTAPTADDSSGTGSYDPTDTGTNDLGDATNWFRNLGPGWLDEAALVLLVLALLIVLRPYASLGASATG